MNSLSCYICDLILSSLKDLVDHHALIHNIHHVIKCKECQESFDDEENAIKHNCAGQELESSYQCLHCSTTHNSANPAISHFTKSHLNKLPINLIAELAKKMDEPKCDSKVLPSKKRTNCPEVMENQPKELSDNPNPNDGPKDKIMNISNKDKKSKRKSSYVESFPWITDESIVPEGCPSPVQKVVGTKNKSNELGNIRKELQDSAFDRLMMPESYDHEESSFDLSDEIFLHSEEACPEIDPDLIKESVFETLTLSPSRSTTKAPANIKLRYPEWALTLQGDVNPKNCRVCQRSFVSKEGAELHFQEEHMIEIIPSPEIVEVNLSKKPNIPDIEKKLDNVQIIKVISSEDMPQTKEQCESSESQNHFRCPYCKETFPSSVHRAHHLIWKHMSTYQWLNNFTSNICNICNKPFSDKRTLQYHLLGKHYNERLPCKQCPELSFCKEFLVAHLLDGHQNLVVGKGTRIVRKKPVAKSYVTQTTTSTIYVCPLCEVCFDRQLVRDTHVTLSHFACPVNGLKKCPKCSSSFTSSQTLKKHFAEKHLPEKWCEECQINVAQCKYDLHIQKCHTKPNELDSYHYSCHLCAYISSNKMDGMWHMSNYHRSLTRDQCQRCPKQIVRNGMNIHTISNHIPAKELEKFICTVCVCSFDNNIKLKDHLLEAHGLKEIANIPTSRGKLGNGNTEMNISTSTVESIDLTGSEGQKLSDSNSSRIEESEKDSEFKQMHSETNVSFNTSLLENYTGFVHSESDLSLMSNESNESVEHEEVDFPNMTGTPKSRRSQSFCRTPKSTYEGQNLLPNIPEVAMKCVSQDLKGLKCHLCSATKNPSIKGMQDHLSRNHKCAIMATCFVCRRSMQEKYLPLHILTKHCPDIGMNRIVCSRCKARFISDSKYKYHRKVCRKTHGDHNSSLDTSVDSSSLENSFSESCDNSVSGMSFASAEESFSQNFSLEESIARLSALDELQISSPPITKSHLYAFQINLESTGEISSQITNFNEGMPLLEELTTIEEFISQAMDEERDSNTYIDTVHMEGTELSNVLVMPIENIAEPMKLDCFGLHLPEAPGSLIDVDLPVIESIGYEFEPHLQNPIFFTPLESDVNNLWDTPKPSKRKYKSFNRVGCTECGKDFANKTSLRSHINQVHLKIMPFQCSHCGKKFPRKPEWRIHDNKCKLKMGSMGL